MLPNLRQRFAKWLARPAVPTGGDPRVRRPRHLRVENLEPRHLLTGGLTLQPLQNVTLQGGGPLEIPVNAADPGGNPVTYTVTSSNPAISASLPTGNPYLKLNVTHTSSGQAGDTSFSGTLIIELFSNLAPNTVAQIVSLVDQGFYNGVVFNRVASSGGSPFVIQAGEPTAADSSITVPTIDNEINENLRYTGVGVVGMARTSADDTNNSQFFITAGPKSFLDFQYTIFGQLVAGNNVRAEINAVPQDNSNGTGDGTPLSPVTITSASIISDPYDLSLMVSAPLGTTGSSTMTMSADDGHGGTDSQSFTVTMNGDASDPGPFFKAITPPTTTVDNPVTFQLPYFDLDPTNNPLTFSSTTASNANLSVTVVPNTGLVTVTPTGGLAGVQSLSFSVSISESVVSSSVSSSPSTRTVPLFITPDAPSGITLLPASDTGSSNADGITNLNNSDPGHALQFEVDGVTAGDTVKIFDGSVEIGSAVVASGQTSVVVTSDGTHVLTDGPHQITAEQVLPNQTYSVGNYHGTTDLTSPPTAAVALTVDAAGPTITSVPPAGVQVGQPFNYTLLVSDPDPTGLVYNLVSGPSGMTVDPATGIVTWTPTAAQLGSPAVDFEVADLAGNTADQTFNVNVTTGIPVTIVSTTAAAGSAFSVGGIIPITITFSTPVTVTGTPQLTLNDGAVVDYSSGDGTTTLTFLYTVAAGDNTARLDYASTSALALDGGAIQDASNNPADLTLPGAGVDGLVSKNIVIDTMSPMIAAVSTTAAANSTFSVGQSLSITISFGEAVLVTGTPQLTLNNGAVVDYASGSGTATLTFDYTVATGQTIADLDYASTMALALNGGTIQDAAGNAADLTLPATGSDGLATKNIAIVSILSDVGVTMTTSAATVLPGGGISFTITVSNAGPNDAQGVTLTDTLPVSLVFGVQTQTSGPAFTLSNSGNAISDTIATLPSGASATFKVIASVGLDTAAGAVITNTATVASSTLDNNTQNNTASGSAMATLTGVMLTPDPLDATKNDLVVGGSAKADNICFLPAAGGKVSVNMDGKLYGPFAVTGCVIAYGQTGNDMITVSPVLAMPAFLYAGPGNCTLVGGGGNNVLVGGGGSDVLVGGPGHNLLIAGTGRSQLYSSRLGVAVGAGDGSILIAGTTDFDHNEAALAAIMQEWGSADPSATKVSTIKGGVGAGVALNSTTVHASSAIDQLFASTGTDWLLAPSKRVDLFGMNAHKTSLTQIN